MSNSKQIPTSSSSTSRPQHLSSSSPYSTFTPVSQNRNFSFPGLTPTSMDADRKNAEPPFSPISGGSAGKSRKPDLKIDTSKKELLDVSSVSVSYDIDEEPNSSNDASDPKERAATTSCFPPGFKPQVTTGSGNVVSFEDVHSPGLPRVFKSGPSSKTMKNLSLHLLPFNLKLFSNNTEQLVPGPLSPMGIALRTFKFPNIPDSLAALKAVVAKLNFVRVVPQVDASFEAVIPYYHMANSLSIWMAKPKCGRGFQELMNSFSHALGQVAQKPSDLDKAKFEPSFIAVCQYVYNEQPCWGRVRILEPVVGDQVKVLFIDLGNDAEVPVSSLLLCPPNLLADLPPVAVRCSLVGLGYEFCCKDLELFRYQFHAIIYPKELLTGRIVDSNKDFHVVDLMSNNGTSVSRSLLCVGSYCPTVLATRQGDSIVAPDRYSNVICNGFRSYGTIDCWIDAPDKIFNILHQMSTAMEAASQDLVVTCPEPNCLCMVQHEDLWLRARVVKVDFDSTVVLGLIDISAVRYGRSNLSGIRPLRQKFADLPVLAVRCDIAGVDEVVNTLRHSSALKLFDFEKALSEVMVTLSNELLEAKIDVEVIDFLLAGSNKCTEEDTAIVKVTLPSGRNYNDEFHDRLRATVAQWNVTADPA